MRPTAPLAFEQIISKPRLDSYRGYFHVGVEEAIGLYMWNCEVSSCWATLLSYFEVALRNNIHRAMSSFYSQGPNSGVAWYDVIRAQLKPDTCDKIDKIRLVRHRGSWVPRVPFPNADEIVSRVTFGFWPAIISVIDQRYVTQLLPSIFPNHPLNATPIDWTNRPIRKHAVAFIYELNEIRNRIAHHEPLWKFPAIHDTSVLPARIIAAESRTQEETLIRFRRLIGLFDSGVKALNSDLYSELTNSTWRLKLDFLLSERGVTRYRTLKHVPESTLVTPADFRSRFSLIGKANQPVRIGGRSRFEGVFHPL